jgi:hypothetical protein
MNLSPEELTILETALGTLLDNFTYEPEDYSDLAMSEENIRDLQVKIFRAGKEIENDQITD